MLNYEKSYKRVCAILFKRNYLLKLNKFKMTNFEILESIDMNRMLQNGDKVKMLEINNYVKNIDTNEGLKEVQKLLKAK